MNPRLPCIALLCAFWISPAFGCFLFADGFENVPQPPPPDQLLPGDVCETATPVSSGISQQTTLCFANNYIPGTGCNVSRASGPDRVYTIAVPAGMTLFVSTQPLGPADVAIMLVSGGAACPVTLSCLAGRDDNGAGLLESLSWTNTTGVANDVRIVVSGISAEDSGSFSLNVVLSN